jgi:primosomal protein N' (replication factor Y)
MLKIRLSMILYESHTDQNEIAATATNHIEVAVALPVFNTFTYSIPENFSDSVTSGVRVLVPFSNRRVTGYVIGRCPASDRKGIKPILDILDDAPLFPESAIDFFKWISDYYIYPLGEVIKCALPGGLTVYDYATVAITAGGIAALKGTALTKAERAVLDLVLKTSCRLKDIQKKPARDFSGSTIHSLEQSGLISIQRQLMKDATRPKTERYVSLTVPTVSREDLSTQRRKILSLLDRQGDMARRDLKKNVPTTYTTINALEQTGHVSSYDKCVYRDPFGERVEPDSPPLLSGEQVAVIDTVMQHVCKEFKTFLLAGVTGSGKTEVYMQLASAVIQHGYAALILIPEIALISEMERRFRARFGDQVAVLHSGLSAGERFDQWQRIRRGEAAIAIGARSAVFAPFSKVGLIVVDEEHDTSYKQEGSLRYNARDLAVVRARLENCVAVLGSATPSIQSTYNASIEKFSEINLDNRIEKRPLPEIVVVDLRKSRDQRGMDRYITAELREAIKATLVRREQVLLFINRRGFASFPVCADCGESIKCKHCDISLTLHQTANAYRCHYCGFSLPATTGCRKCGSDRIRHLGLGTEKVETAMQKLFPDAVVTRMDRDTTSRKGAIVKILKDLRDRRIDILVGTQMVAKGHDFPNITLVGIICADLSLSFPDFRAGERTFQLLAQVSGRAGRGEAPGKVILQTYNPDHFSITAAREQNFKAFYDEEINFRKTLKYPPFSRIIQLKVSGRDRNKTARHAKNTGNICLQLKRKNRAFSNSVEIMGPIEAVLTRVAGKYRWQILLKSAEIKSLHRFTRKLVFENPALFNRSDIKIAVDVDPFSLM